MARAYSAMVLVCLVLAMSLCVADAGRVSDRKLLQDSGLGGLLGGLGGDTVGLGGGLGGDTVGLGGDLDVSVQASDPGGLGGGLGNAEFDFDASALSVDLGGATASVDEFSGDVAASTSSDVGRRRRQTVALKSGKVSKLSAANVKVQNGAVEVRFRVLGVDKVVALNLAKLKPFSRDGRVVAVVVLVLDEAKSVMHLRNRDGECALPAGVGFTVNLH